MKYSDCVNDRLSPRHIKSLTLGGPFKAKTILNIGCYNGWLEKVAVSEKAAKVVGVDTNERFVRLSKKEVPEANFLKASVSSLPFENEGFDVVCLFEVLEHLPNNDIKKSTKEIARVLKPNGKLIFSTPHNNLLNNIFDPAWYFGHRHYTVKEIRKIFENAGLKLSLVEVKGSFFQIATLILIYVFKWLFKKEIPFKEFFNKKREKEYLTDRKGIHTLFAIFVKES